MDYLNLFPGFNPGLMLLVLIWSMFWKALAIWRAAKGNQRYWFVAILVINTLGILEIIYLFKFSKERLTVDDLRKGNLLP